MTERSVPLLLLAQVRLWEILNEGRRLGQQSKLKLLVVLAFAMAFWFGLYAIFHHGFGYLHHKNFAEFMPVLIGNILSLFFFSLTLMLVFSNAIICYSALYRSRESGFLLSCPVPFEQLFFYKFGESLLFSSWAFLFLGTPLVVAYGVTVDAPWYFYSTVLVLFGLFIFIPAGIGSFVAMVVAYLFPRAKGTLLRGTVLIALAGALWLIYQVLQVRGTDNPFSAAWMKGVFETLEFCRNPLFPSYWVSMAIVSCGRAELPVVGFYLLLIVANGLLWGLFCDWMAIGCFWRSWSTNQGVSARRRVVLSRLVDGLVWPFLVFAAPKVRLIVLKDLKTFCRDPVQWSQFLIFFGLLAVYFLNLGTLRYDMRSDIWKNIISVLNVLAVSLTLSTFTSRFVFPQLSLEGRRFWVIGVAPLEREEILVGKFVFCFGGTLLVSEALMLISSLMLRVSGELLFFHALVVMAICLGLSGLSVGLGAVYPDFKEDNPSKIISGFGGTLNLVLNLFFAVLIVLIEGAFLIRPMELGGDFKFWIAVTVTLVMMISLGFCLVPMVLGLRAIRRLEV